MQDDLSKLQGKWSIKSLEVDGMVYNPATFAESKLVIQGNSFTSLAMGAAYEGTIQVVAHSTPKTFSMKFTKGPEQGNTNLGIYELDDDTWKICLGTSGGPAPQRFTTTPGTGHALEVLTRDR